MSDAGAYSDRGDDYQRAIALKWAVQMLDDRNIASMEVQVTSLGPNKTSITVDDIVIRYSDGKTKYLQCKNNQTDHREWRISDQTIKDELIKVKQQLKNDSNGIVSFWSVSEFGLLKKLREYLDIRPDIDAFLAEAAQKNKQTLESAANIWGVKKEEAFELWKKIEFNKSGNYSEILSEVKSQLRFLVNNSDIALALLLKFITERSSKISGVKHSFTRDELKNFLASNGVLQTPIYNERELINTFKAASSIGRQWIREIAGKRIDRKALDEVLECINQKTKTILITDDPGSGKTCLLLELVDRLQNDSSLGVLFIKADHFAQCSNNSELEARGLPDNIIGQVARLAEYRHVIVIIDSLDVVSLNRANGSLQLFLALMDQLESIQNVTTIAACRDFDRRYDQHLKARQWQKLIHIGALNWETEVLPFLQIWQIDTSGYSNIIKSLLCNPRKLWIFEELAKRGQASAFESEQALIQRYIEVVVLEDHDLGQTALKLLQSLSSKLIKEHGQWLPITTVTLPDAIRLKLLSSELLVIDQQTGQIGFAHQTLVEGLAIQAAISSGQTLLSFLNDHPPLPSLRPVVRAFFFYLRTFDHKSFRRQVREVLDDIHTAFHIKRLLAESFAEVTPENDDWNLARHLYQNHPELFKSFLWSMQKENWLFFLNDHWLPIVKQDSSKQLGNEFAGLIDRWIKSNPIEVVSLWKDAVNNTWIDRQWARNRLPISLDGLEDWTIQGVKDLILYLIQDETPDRDFIGKVLSRWVEANNTGYDLLWSYITKNIINDDTFYYRLNGELNCEPHTFSRESFLPEIMSNSEALLNMAISDVELWSKKMTESFAHEKSLYDGFLSDTSWELTHSADEIRHIDATNILMNAIEAAILKHAELMTPWWQLNSKSLCVNFELAIRYFVVKACTYHPQQNLANISILITDPELPRSRINHEVDELITASYHLLDNITQDKHQQIILTMYSEESVESLPDWTIAAICTHLERVPACFRNQESIDFLNSHLHQSTPFDRKPVVYSSGGCIGSPIDQNVLLGFSDNGLITLFNHYSSVGDVRSETYQGRLIGGESQISSVVREAASISPERFINFLNRYWTTIPHNFRESIVSGLSNHIRYHSGELQQPQNLKIDTTSDVNGLSLNLLSILEKDCTYWINKHEAAEVILACSTTIVNELDINRLVFFSVGMANSDEPKEVLRNGHEELISTAINSVLGKLAEAMIKLANRLLESNRPMPDLLIPLIYRFSNHSNHAVRAILLMHLPYFQFKLPQIGWELFENIMKDARAEMWSISERCLYYGYGKNFSIINKYLERIHIEAINDAGQIWGRISALSHLSNHLSHEELITKLIALKNEKAWLGVAEVYAANIQISELNDKCLNGLLATLKHATANQELLNKIGNMFNNDSNVTSIPIELITNYFKRLSQLEGRHDPYHFVEWVSVLATVNPMRGLEASECLCDFLNARNCQLWHKDSIAMLLTTLYRDAEDSGDLQIIKRVVAVQDTFFKHGAYGLEEWLKAAER